MKDSERIFSLIQEFEHTQPIDLGDHSRKLSEFLSEKLSEDFELARLMRQSMRIK